MKKFTAIMVALILVAMTAVTAFAAGINENEKKVIDALGNKIAMKGGDMVVPADFVNQAENYFNTIDMTAEQADKIVALLKTTGEFMTSTGATNIPTMTYAQKKELLNRGKEIVAVLGMTMEYDFVKKVLFIYDSQGNVKFESDPVLTVVKVDPTQSNTDSTNSTSTTNKTNSSTTSNTAIKTTGLATDFSGFVAVGAFALVIVAGATAYVLKKKEA